MKFGKEHREGRRNQRFRDQYRSENHTSKEKKSDIPKDGGGQKDES